MSEYSFDGDAASAEQAFAEAYDSLINFMAGTLDKSFANIATKHK